MQNAPIGVFPEIHSLAANPLKGLEPSKQNIAIFSPSNSPGFSVDSWNAKDCFVYRSDHEIRLSLQVSQRPRCFDVHCEIDSLLLGQA